MSFTSWCLCQVLSTRCRLCQLDEAIQRTRIVREREAAAGRAYEQMAAQAPK